MSTLSSRPTNRLILVASGAAVAIMVATSVWGWTQIPDDAQIPIHWGLDGESDGFPPKAVGLFLLPVFGLIVSALLAIVPSVEPRRENLNRSGPAYRAVWLGSWGSSSSSTSRQSSRRPEPRWTWPASSRPPSARSSS